MSAHCYSGTTTELARPVYLHTLLGTMVELSVSLPSIACLHSGA